MTMKVIRLLCACLLLVFSACSKSQYEDKVVIDLNKRGASVSPSMYGIFFEEINHAGDGGLYAELVQNRNFMEKEMPEGYHTEKGRVIPKPVKNHLTGEVRSSTYHWNKDSIPAWQLRMENPQVAQMEITRETPKFQTAPNNLKLTIHKKTTSVQLINTGYWGMNIQAGETYLSRAIIRTSPDYTGGIKLRLLSSKNKELASEILSVKPDGCWHDVKLRMHPSASDAKAHLALEFDAPGTVWIDYVSLFPEHTFHNRPNGLRKDVAEMLAGMKPAFVRWPGGCVVEGITLDNRFEWKKSLGDPAARPGEYSTWGYRCSYGLGYYEMLQFCEDIGAKAMFVCNVGIGCQFRMGDACSEQDVEYYIKDCLDAIEYAIGDVNTPWGKRRADDGHPSPFPLQYVEIGNENWGPVYDRRFNQFYERIKSQYPQLTLIYNEMKQRGGEPAITKTDMIDPHWYVDPLYFLHNTNLFDRYERGKYKIYVGEYAVNKKVGSGNMYGALAEAAFIGGMERNGDLVTMASYAPLLENSHNRTWSTNLIWMDNDKVLGRSSYYVQKMAAENRPDYNVLNKQKIMMKDAVKLTSGYIGFGTRSASTEFKDIKVHVNGKVIVPKEDSYINVGTSSKIEAALGNIVVKNGQKILLEDMPNGKYTVTCKVRNMGKGEGFQLYQCMSKDGKNGLRADIGIWKEHNRMELVYINDGKDLGYLADKTSEKEITQEVWHDIKLEVSATKSELFVDGTLVLSYISQPIPVLFYYTGYDEKSGELILKVVNAEDTSHRASFKIKGATDIAESGKIISLSSDKGTDENSYENPRKIYPQESIYHHFGKTVHYSFPPYSYTIMRIKAKHSNVNKKH